MAESILKHSKTEPYTYYTPDGMFKVSRCTVRAYGWDISERRENGEYRIATNAGTLDKARRLIGGKK